MCVSLVMRLTPVRDVRFLLTQGVLLTAMLGKTDGIVYEVVMVWVRLILLLGLNMCSLLASVPTVVMCRVVG